MMEASQYIRLFAETITQTLRQTVIILVHTREIPGSVLGKESTLTQLFIVFSAPPDKCRDNKLKCSTTAPKHIF